MSTAISECLDDEIKPLGLRSICLEPGMFRTKLLESGNRGEYAARIEGEPGLTLDTRLFCIWGLLTVNDVSIDYKGNVGAMAKAFGGRFASPVRSSYRPLKSHPPASSTGHRH